MTVFGYPRVYQHIRVLIPHREGMTYEATFKYRMENAQF